MPAICAAQDISGFVKDMSGGVVPGASVTATQLGTGLGRTTVTNTAGYYVIPDVPIGEYTVAAELVGFKRFSHPGVVVRVDSHVTVNPVLEVGSVAESVIVRADAPMSGRRRRWPEPSPVNRRFGCSSMAGTFFAAAG